MIETFVCPLDKTKKEVSVVVERNLSGETKPFACPVCGKEHVITSRGLVAIVVYSPLEEFEG